MKCFKSTEAAEQWVLAHAIGDVQVFVQQGTRLFHLDDRGFWIIYGDDAFVSGLLG